MPRYTIESRPPACLPRSSLDQSHHATIDSALKDLKVNARTLHVVFTACTDESRILDRLFYKGRNQHRGALFWRRAAEVRKLCHRLDEMAVYDSINVFRCSFFGAVSGQSAKSFKGPWTHVPDVPFVTYVVRRLTLCSVLVEKMQERLNEAYRSFVAVMQSGAFVQLILTLVAITSRIGTLLSELHEGLRCTSLISRCLLSILHPLDDKETSAVLPTPISGDELSAISLDDNLRTIVNNPKSLSKSSNAQPLSVPSTENSISNPEPAASHIIYKRKAVSIGTVGKKTRKKTVKDEIDDIFGF